MKSEYHTKAVQLPKGYDGRRSSQGLLAGGPAIKGFSVV
jgi:hypothetical protein